MHKDLPKDGDPRVRRTHQLLRDALIDLVSEQGFDTVTVGEIAERAKVNRATFYRHYEDKYDLVAQIFAEAVETMSHELGPPEIGLEEVDPGRTPGPWVKLFEHFERHSRLYRALLGRNGSPWFAARLRDHIASLLRERERLREQLPGRARRPEQVHMPREVAATFIATLGIGIVAWWLEDVEERYSAAQIATWFRGFVLRGYAYALGDAQSL
jgi:AcrR family transcriptional regulator